MEEVLKYIDSKYINVDAGEQRSANQTLQQVLNKVTQSLREVSPLFNALFETYLYAGSSYDGLKIGKPDEYDIDLKLYLPDILNVKVRPTDKHGFVSIFLEDWQRFVRDQRLYSIYKELEDLKDSNNYLSHKKIKQWMESIVTKAIQRIGNPSGLNVKYKVSGPAVTLIVGDKMTIDLVAVFRMPGKKWPATPVRQNKFSTKPDFIVVPKEPKFAYSYAYNLERYWRLSFPEPEKEHMSGHYYCKPALRLIKKLRDTHNHNIPSYFIKSIFLWEIENNTKSRNFWNSSTTNVFIEMLKTYKVYLDKGKIPYYWDERHNLLEAKSDINLGNIRNFLHSMIQDIERSGNTNSFIIAKYVLPTQEYIEVCRRFGVFPQ